MTYPLDKLGLINAALALCGDELCAVADDGSPEWNTASAAYETAIEYMLESKATSWKSATTIKVLQPTGILPEDTWYDTAYAKPPDMIHLIWVRYADVPILYRIVHNQIYVRLFSAVPAAIPSPPPVLQALSAKYLSSNGDITDKTRMFATALILFVRAGIYGGLHEEPTLEMQFAKAARAMVAEAAAVADQEQPKRSFFNHRITARRRVRGPWRAHPDSWGGTGGPSGSTIT